MSKCMNCGSQAAKEDRFCATCLDDGSAEGFMEGMSIALDGMDLPDGAYMAMADEFGVDLGDFE